MHVAQKAEAPVNAVWEYIHIGSFNFRLSFCRPSIILTSTECRFTESFMLQLKSDDSRKASRLIKTPSQDVLGENVHHRIVQPCYIYKLCIYSADYPHHLKVSLAVHLPIAQQRTLSEYASL